jgi:hypothetical protein
VIPVVVASDVVFIPVEISMRCAPVVVDGRQGNTGVRHMHQCVRRLQPLAGWPEEPIASGP